MIDLYVLAFHYYEKMAMDGDDYNRKFEKLVQFVMMPYFQEYGIDLKKIDDGVYEADGVPCVLRIRRGKGHMPGLLVTLAEPCDLGTDKSDVGREIGLGVIANLNGSDEVPVEVGYDQLDCLFNECVKCIDKNAIPYLTNGRYDLSDVRKYLERKMMDKCGQG